MKITDHRMWQIGREAHSQGEAYRLFKLRRAVEDST
jgi:hypothetical protein